VSYGVGHRCILDLVLLWLWCRPVSTALIRLLAWEHPYATGMALKRTKYKKKKKRVAARVEGDSVRRTGIWGVVGVKSPLGMGEQ